MSTLPANPFSPRCPPIRRLAARVAALTALVLTGVTTPANAAEPDEYDPILDDLRNHASDPRQQRRVRPVQRGTPGLTVGGGAAIYAGKVKSFHNDQDSMLLTSSRPGVVLELGSRTADRMEIGLTTMFGFGRTYKTREVYIEVPAVDLLVEPRALYHLYEDRDYGLYAGAAASIYLFALAEDGVSQGGAGPSAVLGGLLRFGRHSVVYLDISATAFRDVLAFRHVEPSEEDLEDNPYAQPEKEEGAWYPIVRLTLGYRLSGFSKATGSGFF